MTRNNPMDFDEYEYLEKSVENAKLNQSRKKETAESKREKVYRKNKEDHDEIEEDEEERERRRKKSRSEDGNGGERKRDERERGRRERDERYRDGDRERDKDRGARRERDREKEKEREREKEKEKEKEKEVERSKRSSSRSRRHGSQELERSSRERDREIDSRDSRRFKERKEDAEHEADPERDQRTVFAYQMPLKATEKDVYEFFSKAGKVRDVRLIMDRNSRRSKGVGYIEFYDAMTVPMAIALSGKDFLGQPVMVKPSEAEKNLVQSTTSSGSSLSGPYGPNDRKLYVGNLHFNVTEPQLRQIFEEFGPVELVQLPLDLETGQCKGFGFIQFAQVEHAKAAQSLNGELEIAGRFIKVSSVTEHVGAQDTTASDFDDDDGGGLGLNARSRLLLMGKLDRSGLASSIAGTHGVPVTNSTTPVQHPIPFLNGHAATPGPTLPVQVLPSSASEPVGTPSECLLLKNLFDPATETDTEFDLDIKDDVSEECSNFGHIRHIYVDKHSAGHVYLRFGKKTDAMEAQRRMHMRWFARRMISAIFMKPQDYEAKFPA